MSSVLNGNWRIPKRYWVTLLAFFGNFLAYLLKINMSIAIIEMTSNKTITIGNKTEVINADFDWSSKEKGVILGAFSIGYAFAFLGGPLVNRFGGARVFGLGLALTAVLAILTPFILYIHLYVFIIGRVLQGLFEGFLASAGTDVFAHWSPKNERTRLISFANVGKPCSVAVNYPLTGYIAYVLGWQAVFYISGAATLVWCLIWVVFISNDPANDPFISDAEKSYLKENTADMISHEKVEVPWKSILTSKPMYALFNEYITVGFAPVFVALYLPLYIKDVHNVNIKDVGLISGIPVFFSVITVPIAACVADYLRSHGFSNSKVHRIFIFWGEVFVLIWLLSAALCGDFVICIICFSLLRISYSVSDTSYNVISIDVAGQYAAIIKAICHSFYSLSNFLNPVILGYMVPNRTQSEWNMYFFFLCFITIYGVAVFMIFGSGELQPWAVVSKNDDTNTDSTNTVILSEKIQSVP